MQILFERAFSLFTRVPASSGALGAFIEIVEPAVVMDALTALPPEVMQALVEHFASKGEHARVETCVLHMSIASLDLNQVR